MLSRLTLVTANGICNRLRTIAAARRLCAQFNAQCRIVWTWGKFDDFFAKPTDIVFISDSSDESHEIIKHTPSFKSVDVSMSDVIVYSVYIFYGSHEKPIDYLDIKNYIPCLNSSLLAIVEQFSKQFVNNVVGFHIRRTDSSASLKHSPDVLFIDQAKQIIESGKKIFLSTDNVETEKQFLKLFPNDFLIYPKRCKLKRRWPRAFDKSYTEDDLIDLFLLSRVEYVFGSSWSSFSSLAITLNGSSQCKILKCP